ncbi:glycosyltransferase family 1 protein [bacterium DOLZORAL124_64_63]|nr:MAG: glycosyltransferase family 1 protein [bacterium DOLZORAL124_64_63]
MNFRGHLLQRLVKDGHQVIALSPEPDTSSLEQISRLGIQHQAFPLQRTGLSPLADIQTVSVLTRILRDFQADHALSYTIKPVIYGSIAAERANVPHRHALITGLGTAFQGASPSRKALHVLVKLLYRKALGKCQSVIFQNPDDRALFLEHRLAKPERTHLVAGSGVDLAHYAEAPLPDGPHFLTIARLIREKGVREYAAAARQVRQEFPGATFNLVGYHEDHISNIPATEVESWQKNGILNFAGRMDDVRPALRDASIYVLPSYREGLPRTVLEAMAMGRPVITTDAPGCRETVIPGENGYLVPVGSAPALAEAMIAFCRNPKTIATMGQASRRLARDRFDVHKVNQDILNIMGLSAS